MPPDRILQALLRHLLALHDDEELLAFCQQVEDQFREIGPGFRLFDAVIDVLDELGE